LNKNHFNKNLIPPFSFLALILSQTLFNDKIMRYFLPQKYLGGMCAFLFFALFFVFSGTSFLSAQTIWENPINGSNTSNSNPFLNGDITNPAVGVSGIGYSTGVTANAGNDRYNARGWNSPSFNSNDYFEWTITPAACKKLNLSSFVFVGQRNNASINGFAFRSSADNFQNNIATPAFDGDSILINSSIFQNLTQAITFRLYAWGGSNENRTYSINSFKFYGSVSNLASAPVITASGSTTFCSGENVVLNSNESTSIQWSNGSTASSITVVNSGNYFATKTNSNGCSANSNTIYVEVKPLPVITIQANPAVACVGTAVTLTATGANSYAWTNGISNGTAFVPTASNTYSVTGTAANGCSNSANMTLSLNQITVSSPLSNGDLVWNGRNNSDMNTISNWLVFNNNSFSTASTLLNSDKNIIIPPTQACVSNQPMLNTNSLSVNNVTIESGANLNLGGGTLMVHGNWIQQGGLSAGTSTVQFTGNNNTSIDVSGGNVIEFHNVTLNKSGDVSLNTAISVNGLFNLTSGKLLLGNYHLNMNNGTIIGGNSNSYIQTNGTGTLLRNLTGSMVYPVGRSTYNPVTLNKPGTAFGFGVRVVDQVTTNGQDNGNPFVTGNVSRMWHITPSSGYLASTYGAVDITLHYSNGANYFSNGFSNAFADRQFMHYGNDWENITYITGNFSTGDNAQGYSWVTQDDVTNFSPFTITNSTSSLPIELISFEANCNTNNRVSIDWSTASENQSSHFLIERSENGTHWMALGTVAAAGNSNEVLRYQMLDENPKNVINYYRLTQFDIDGKSESFEVVTSLCQQAPSSVKMVSFPNPSNGDFNVVFVKTDNSTQLGELRVLNMHGQAVHVQEHVFNMGINEVVISSETLKPGIYSIHVVDDKGVAQTVLHQIN
jgi:hypothetical protein